MELLVDSAWSPPPEVCAALLDELIGDLSRSLAHEFHAATHRPGLSCAACAAPCASLLPPLGALPGPSPLGGGSGLYAVGDIHGNILNNKADVKCPCPLCHISFPVSRFAPHLEKCLGLGGCVLLLFLLLKARPRDRVWAGQTCMGEQMCSCSLLAAPPPLTQEGALHEGGLLPPPPSPPPLSSRPWHPSRQPRPLGMVSCPL